MKRTWIPAIAGLALLTAGNENAEAALSFADVGLWAGAPAGAGVNEAALVIDWRDGAAPLVWGYRWLETEAKTGQDMISAVLALDPRLGVQNFGFIDGWSFNTDQTGAPERLRTFSDQGTPSFLDDTYWGYWVNNAVYYHPTDFLQNSHIVPPATTVIPNGNPYAAVSPGSWVESPTAASQRPLVNGSWDGWAYGVFGTQPAAPVPEPGTGGIAALGLLALLTRRRRALPAAALIAAMPGIAAATGPYAPAADQPGTTAIPAASPLIKAWATSVTSLVRGRQNISLSSGALTSYGTAASAIGAPTATVDNGSNALHGSNVLPTVSLGDGGSITVSLTTPVTNGPGADFAVFENGFIPSFLELAFVEVSSDGTNFVRFPAVSCTQATTQIGQFTSTTSNPQLDARNIHNLAGKYLAGYGTLFDLEDVKSASALVNVNRITHIRMVDVVGSINPAYGSRDSLGNLINDPWPTEFFSGGFDLDAVGAINLYNPPWNSWAATHFSAAELGNAAVSGPLADADSDGVANAVEYFTGTAPRTPGGSAAALGKAPDGSIVLKFGRAGHTDADCELQHSTVLGGWQAVARSTGGSPFVTTPAGSTLQITETTGSPREVSVTIPPAADGGFYQLAVNLR